MNALTHPYYTPTEQIAADSTPGLIRDELIRWAQRHASYSSRGKGHTYMDGIEDMVAALDDVLRGHMRNAQSGETPAQSMEQKRAAYLAKQARP